MRIVNTVCISNEKAVQNYPEGGGWGERGLNASVQEWDLLRSKLNICGQGKRCVGVRNLTFFVDVLNE